MTRLTPKQSKAAALALLAAVLVIVCGVVAAPLWMMHRHYDVAIEDASSRLERYLKIAGMRAGLQKQFDAVKVLGTAGHFLKSASPALAAAEIQEQAKGIVEVNGGKLSSMQILPHKDDGLYRQIPVALQLTGTLTALKKILHALESSHPYLFLDNFTVRSPMANAARNASAVEPEIFIQFDLTGYALKGEQ